MGMAALLMCGTVNANSWRVCSKPEAGANFTSVAAAVASNSVFAGDTLYVEPGHFENTGVSIDKSLVIIGPGYLFEDNNINVMNPEAATFNAIYLTRKNTQISGLKLLGGVTISDTSCTVKNCYIRGTGNVIYFNSGTGHQIMDCLIYGNIGANGYFQNQWNLLIQNNIIYGKIECSPVHASIIRNNTVIGYSDIYNYRYSNWDNGYCIVNVGEECEIYNNIVINTCTNYYTQTDANQNVDTSFSEDYTITRESTCDVYNNILSGHNYSLFRNCVFNQQLEDVLIWNNANTIEEKFKHLATGPAVGSGVNGTTCGAYGQVSGGRAYQPAGIPQNRPYIYDADIDNTPSSNNTINASFKIKVQQ